MNLFKLNEKCLEYAKAYPIAYEIYGTHKRYAYFAPLAMTLDKETWILRKRNACLRFEMSTHDLYEKNQGNEKAFYQKYALNPSEYTLTPGAVPLFNKEKHLIGVITITGLKPEEDHRIALEIADALELL